MIRRAIAICAALIIVAGIGLAEAKPGGIARQLAMGGSNVRNGLAVNPFIFRDPSFILINPAYQGYYKDYVWLNVAGGSLSGFGGQDRYGAQNAGVNFSLAKRFTIGTVLSYDPSLTNTVVTQLASFINQVQPGRAQIGLAPVEVIELTGTMDMGPADIGIGLLYGRSKNQAETSGPSLAGSNAEHSASVLGIRAGLLWNLGRGSAVDASAAVRFDNVSDNLTGTNTAGAATNNGEYSASATELEIIARATLRMSQRASFVPYAAYGMVSGEPKQDAPPTGGTAFTGSQDISASVLAVGAGMEYRTEEFYFAGGLSWQTASFETKVTPPPPATGTTTSTLSVTGLPVVNMGAEWWFLEWLAGRFGYYRAFSTTTNKTEPPTGGVTTEQSRFTGLSIVNIGNYSGTDNSLITLGIGLQFGGFALDAMVSEDALRRGFGLVGASDNLNTFGYMTASYSFE
ncbi:MAG: hypothetical protein WBG01_03475 [Bacteroidota bacterium]